MGSPAEARESGKRRSGEWVRVPIERRKQQEGRNEADSHRDFVKVGTESEKTKADGSVKPQSSRRQGKPKEVIAALACTCVVLRPGCRGFRTERFLRRETRSGQDSPKSVREPQSTEKGYAQFSRRESESSKTSPLPHSLRTAVPFSQAQYLSHDLECG